MNHASMVRVERVDDIAVLTLQRGKGNSLNPMVIEELFDSLRREDVAEGSRALVITGDGKFFSTGLDLVELTELDQGRMLAFLDRLQGFLSTIFVWSRPVIAAINGHAVAGGCLLALASDWRVLSRGDVKMGLNEIALGLPLPQAGLEIARAQLSTHSFSEVVYGGDLHGPEECLRLGLADQLADPDQVLAAALEVARRWGKHDPVAFHRVKAGLRDRVLLRIREHHDEHQEEWVNLWFSPKTRTRIEAARTGLLQKRR